MIFPSPQGIFGGDQAAGEPLAATPLHRMLGRRGLTAVERLMGMLLVMMSVEMMLDALRSLELT